VWLYWQVYGIDQVTNNELLIWFVNRYISQEKGHKVNLVKVIASIAWEKAWREEAKIMKSGFEELSKKSGGEGFAKFERKFLNSPLSALNVDALDKQHVAMCPYGVLKRAMTKVNEVHNLVQDS
jgi:hypothetical protein